GADRCRSAGQRPHGERVRAQRLDRTCFGAVDVGVRDPVDDRVRAKAGHGRHDGWFVSDVEVCAAERAGLVTRSALLRYGGAELAARADNGDAHQATRDETPASTARICASSSTPSHRATTAVAMQLPITFTAVRPMSMIWSMPRRIAAPSSGRPNCVKVAARTTSAARGTPATPLLVSISVSIMTSCWPSVIDTPASCATNTLASDR